MRRLRRALCALTSMLVGALATAGVGARPVAAAPRMPTPIFECSFKLTSGAGYKTVWGYDNQTGHSTTIAVGRFNEFYPGGSNQGQPTTFATGRHDNVLVVPWDGSAQQNWWLGFGTASASKNTVCSSTPVPVTGTGLSEVFAILVVAASSVLLLRYLRNRDQRKANR